MDVSTHFLEQLSKYKGKKIMVCCNNAAIRNIGYFEGILGEVFGDGFFVTVGDDQQGTRICYLRNIAFVQVVNE